MDIKIYQIDMDRDKDRIAFESLERLEKYQGSAEVRSDLYDKVFEGEVNCKTLEGVFQMFNHDHPDGYRGRSLSVSDVVEVSDDTGASKFYFCDSVGFKEIPFDAEKAGALETETIRVVLLEPGKPPEAVDIENTLHGFQKAVGGPIEVYEPYNEQVCFICNRDGKETGLPLNRIVPEEDKQIEMNYRELVMHFREIERSGKNEHLNGLIVISQESFKEEYSEASRTYGVSSDNKAFQPNMGGYSIYASAIDGSDPMVRLEKYLAVEQGGKDGWRIERCYLEQPGEKALDVIAGTCFICAGAGDTFKSLSPEQIGRFQKRFKTPLQEQVQQRGQDAKEKKPSVIAKLRSYSNMQQAANPDPAKKKKLDRDL